MNNTRLKNIIDNLNIKGKMRYIEGVTPKQVIDFEKQMELNYHNNIKIG